MKKSRLLGTACASLYWSLIPPQGLAATFMGLGDLPSGNFWSQAYDVSYNGTVVVGTSNSDLGGEIFHWDLEGGISGIGVTSTRNVNVSDNGNIIAGTQIGSHPFLWSESSGAISTGINNGVSYDISGDGLVIVGTAFILNSDPKAFKWTAENGLIDLGTTANGGDVNVALGASYDGSVIVGSSRLRSTGVRDAFRWTASTGMVSLGDLPGGDHYGTADSVSADGSVIVGWGTTEFGPEAYRWTEQTGMVGLGDLSGGIFASGAADVSADGSIVVGVSESSIGLESYIWDEQNGMRNLQGLLESTGLDLSEWTLSNVTAISGDGSTVVGYGINPDGLTEAWIANITAVPIPPALWLFGSGLLGLIGIARKKAA